MANPGKWPKGKFPFKPTGNVGAVIVFINGIVANITANSTLFPTPSPSLATITTGVTNVLDAQTEVQKRVAGSVAERNQRFRVLMVDMRKLLAYVQALADASADAEQAAGFITAAGFQLNNGAIFEKPPLAVRFTHNPSEAKLVAKSAGKRSSYNWQQSQNNGSTWTSLPDTIVASTKALNLNSGVRYFFRVRSITKEGVSAWSNAVGIVMQ